MIHELPNQRRRVRRGKRRPRRPVFRVFERPAGGGAAALAYPGYPEPPDEDARRTLLTGSLAALLHLAGFGLLFFLASLHPLIEQTIIPVRILREEEPPPAEPAEAPKALAERRPLPFDPAVQAVAPQIVNPRVIAEASPAVRADALAMDSLGSVAAPTEIQQANRVVDRVSAVRSSGRAPASAIDVTRIAGPVVRGPLRADAATRPSVGPRRVEAAEAGTTMGTAPLAIGGGSGSSVREGVLSDRDVVGSPDGSVIMSVDTTIGEGLLRGGTGASGTGTGSPSEGVANPACLERPEVQSYLDEVRNRTYARWILPPGIEADRKVTLRFRIDVAGSPTSVSILHADDNALGASAVDALRAAAPFPPMPEQARCLSRMPIRGIFSNPIGG